ncbi:hypothetical protein VNI00_010656 [Paramarasmius palmivorus]|uniref:Uncharacterized protein n=1 Tax=Paramarasmius palmivorus TaxID=297713 RepID=A0AAW0CKP5_9AGAR
MMKVATILTSLLVASAASAAVVERQLFSDEVLATSAVPTSDAAVTATVTPTSDAVITATVVPTSDAVFTTSVTATTPAGPVDTSLPDPACGSYFKYLGFYRARYSAACALLASTCRARIEGGLTDIWSDNTCVATATCQGTSPTVGMAGCLNNNIRVLGHEGQQSLNYNLYAQIVGDCAWAPGGCPITQQNYIDFVYGTLSSIGSTVWPDVQADVIDLWWAELKEWTATGDSVPYLNFNDWLHYSHSPTPY